MSLLGKFTNVKVDNVSRIPQDDLDYIEKVMKEYNVVLDYNNSILDFTESLTDERKDRTDRIFTYQAFSKSDSLEVIRKDISNLHHRCFQNIAEHFCNKYNIVLDIEKMNIFSGYTVGNLYHNQRYVDYRGDHDRKFDVIRGFKVDYNTILDYIFSNIGGLNLNDFKYKESIEHFGGLYSVDSHRADIKITKNGVLTFPNLFGSINNHYHREENTRCFKSLKNILELVYKDELVEVNKVFNIDNITNHFSVGSQPYKAESLERIFTKLEINDNVVDYILVMKNGNFKLKFNNFKLANNFLDLIK